MCYLKVVFPSNTGRSEPSNYYYYPLLSLQYNIELKAMRECTCKEGNKINVFYKKPWKKKEDNKNQKKRRKKDNKVRLF